MNLQNAAVRPAQVAIIGFVLAEEGLFVASLLHLGPLLGTGAAKHPVGDEASVKLVVAHGADFALDKAAAGEPARRWPVLILADGDDKAALYHYDVVDVSFVSRRAPVVGGFVVCLFISLFGVAGSSVFLGRT